MTSVQNFDRLHKIIEELLHTATAEGKTDQLCFALSTLHQAIEAGRFEELTAELNDFNSRLILNL